MRSRIRGLLVFSIAVLCLGSGAAAGLERTWGFPVPLTPNPGADAGTDNESAVVACNAPGHYVAFWVSNYVVSEYSGTLSRSRTTDGGLTWSAPQTVLGKSSSPVAVRSSNGTIVCTWHDFNLGYRIMFTRSTDGGLTWTSPAPLQSNFSGGNYSAMLATDDKGVWVCTWTVHMSGNPSGNDYDIYFSRSTDDGVTWSSRTLLNSTMSTDGAVDDWPQEIATDGNGIWMVIWASDNKLSGTLGTGTHLLYSRSTDNGITWGAANAVSPVALLNTGTYGGRNRLVTDKAGTWITAGHSNSNVSGNGADLDIVTAKTTDNGISWGPFTPINTYQAADNGDDVHPVLRIGADGELVLVWGSASTFGGMKTNGRHIMSAQSWDKGDTWSTVTLVNPPESSSSVLSDTPLDMTCSPFGGWLLTSQCTNRTGADFDVFVYAGVPDARVTTDTLDFGTVSTVSPHVLSTTLVNEGLTTLTFASQPGIFGADSPEFSLDPVTTAPIGPNQSANYTLRFTPVSTGQKLAQLLIVTNDMDEPATTVTLTGRGVPEIDVTPAQLTFAARLPQEGATPAQLVNVTNTGAAPLTFTGSGFAIAGRDATQFLFTQAPVITSVASGASRSVSIAFDPQNEGAKTAALTITSNDSDESTVNIPLTAPAAPQSAAADWQLFQ